MAVTILLFGSWFLRRRREQPDSLLPGIAVQLMALLVLAAVLLPVISLTDDLQASVTPAETEHLCRRSDLQLNPDRPLQIVSVAFGLPLPTLNSAPMQVIAFLTKDESASRQMRGYFRTRSTRPPPAV